MEFHGDNNFTVYDSCYCMLVQTLKIATYEVYKAREG